MLTAAYSDSSDSRGKKPFLSIFKERIGNDYKG
jgi:hypothetical protein